MRRKLRLGLALGSGSARGWAHIGVIRALEERGIKPDLVCGTSIGATGAILTVKALYELERSRKRYALVTMCIGGGQGIAAIFERL